MIYTIYLILNFSDVLREYTIPLLPLYSLIYIFHEKNTQPW